MAIKYPINNESNCKAKQQGFFELCDTLEFEATENLIKKMGRRHEWRRLAELVKYKEELRSCKNDIKAAAGAAI